MENLVAIFWIIIFIAALNSISARFAGPFYCVQEGFFPRSADNEYVSFDTIIKASKVDPENRKIYGNFTFKKPMEKMGMESEMFKESNNEWKQYGKSWPIENMCNTPYKIDHFENVFSAKIDKEKCSVKAGNYHLDGYNVEEDIKASTQSMIYGHWKMIIKVKAEVDGKMVEVMVMTYQLWFNDEANKKQPMNKGKGNKGNKGNKGKQ